MAQLDDAVRQVRLRLRYRTDRTDLVRREVGELPLAAVREAVVNALVHRDYRSTAPVQVNLTDDRLTVWSPGHLPSPLTVASLRRVHPSIPSNPRIARAMYLAGFIEEWGTGTLRIVDSMREHGNGEPLFEAPLGGVSVTLLGAEEATLTRRQASVVHLLRSAGSAA